MSPHTSPTQPNSCVEALTCYVVIFGDRFFRRKLRLSEVLVWCLNLIRLIGLIWERGELALSPLCTRQGKAKRTQGGSSCRQCRQLSPGTVPAGIPVLDFPVRNFCCSNHPDNRSMGICLGSPSLDTREWCVCMCVRAKSKLLWQNLGPEIFKKIKLILSHFLMFPNRNNVIISLGYFSSLAVTSSTGGRGRKSHITVYRGRPISSHPSILCDSMISLELQIPPNGSSRFLSIINLEQFHLTVSQVYIMKNWSTTMNIGEGQVSIIWLIRQHC